VVSLPREVIDDRGWSDLEPVYQLRLREAHILDLGGGPWVTICIEAGRLIGAEVLTTFPSLGYVAQLRANGYAIRWALVSPAS
jgi:hypothetical protein